MEDICNVASPSKQAYLGPSLISRPFLYHLTDALSLDTWHVNSASSNSVTVWSLSCAVKSVGASLIISSAEDLLAPAAAVYSPSSSMVQSLMVKVCLFLSTRYTTRLLKVISWPAFNHWTVTFGLFTLQVKLTVFFSSVSQSSRGSMILSSSSVEKPNVRIMSQHF